MRISIRYQDDVVIVSLSGKFAAGADGPFLRNKTQELFDAGARKMIVDFTDVPYIDSTGLGFLAASRTVAEKTHADMILCGIAPAVKQILDRVQLTQFFTIEKDEAAALARFATRTKTAGGDVTPSGSASG